MDGGFFFGQATAETLLLNFEFFLFELNPLGGLSLADSVVEIVVDQGATSLSKGAGKFSGAKFKKKDEYDEVRETEDKDGPYLAEDWSEEFVIQEVADVAPGHLSSWGRRDLESTST
jgi:hypothetical protein